ncbi:MAG TPA: DoxX family protein [Longimicrobiales bacterium]|nr:DoxX family protein [Longimicrobiales bacterium]
MGVAFAALVVLPQLAAFESLALFLLRVWLALVFATSGWSHVTRPRERAESIGMSPAFTAGLGVVELAGAALLVLGILTRVGALLLIGVMLGAIYKKIFVWETGLWGEEGSLGWYYDALYLIGNLVVLATGGGTWTLA